MRQMRRPRRRILRSLISLLLIASLVAIILQPLLFLRGTSSIDGAMVMMMTMTTTADVRPKSTVVVARHADPLTAENSPSPSPSPAASKSNNSNATTTTTAATTISSSSSRRRPPPTTAVPDPAHSTYPYDFYANIELSQNDNKKRKLSLLSVPFYVYPELLMNDNITIGKKPLRYIDMDYWRHHMDAGQPMKHSEDYYFARMAIDHPMRATDPSKVRIFLVPLLINAIAEHTSNKQAYSHQDLCWNGICNLKILSYAEDVLLNSTWYQRSGGKDHILVGGHFFVERLLLRHYRNRNRLGGGGAQPLRQMNTIRFENRDLSVGTSDDHEYYSMASTYVGKGCTGRTTAAADGGGGIGDVESKVGMQKTHDFAFIANTPPHKFEFRREFCSFLKESSSQQSFTTIGCGPMHECPSLGRARFGFHMKGDTYGSNRLMNTLLSNTVPIFMYSQQYEILPQFIDWHSMSYFIDYETLQYNTTELGLELNAIIRDREGYRSKLEQIRMNKDLLDYSTNVPFEMYMFGLQCHLNPLTCSNSNNHRYPALRFDDNVIKSKKDPGGMRE